MKFPASVSPSVPCLGPKPGGPRGCDDRCNAPITVSRDCCTQYFAGVGPQCGACKYLNDWWELLRMAIRTNLFPTWTYSAVGAETTLIEQVLESGKTCEVKLLDGCLPKDARILDISYTPQAAGVFPLEAHGNRPERYAYPSVLTLYGRPVAIPGSPRTDAVPVVILVTWMPPSGNDEAQASLVEAFHAYAGGRYRHMVVPANVAVEFSLGQILDPIISLVASKDRKKEFLKAVTYSGRSRARVALRA